MPVITNPDPLEPRLDPDLGLTKPEMQQADEGASYDGAPDKPDFTDGDVLNFLAEAKRIGRTYQQTAALADWETSQAAYRSEHSGTSKYSKDQYKNRAKYFKPKTRAAVRKNLTATAHALFASKDVLVAEAENDSDPRAVANAALIKEIVDARFNSKAMKTGVPWLEVALGARMDCQIMSACCSKQTWTFKSRTRKVKSQKDQPVIIDGVPGIDKATGEPMMEVVDVEEDVEDVLLDKPEITLIPLEYVLLDPGTSWINPAQNSPTMVVIWPMHIDSVKEMMKEKKGFTPWRQVSDDQLKASFYSEAEIMGLKAAREGSGTASQTRRATAAFGGDRNEICEVWECFFKRNGCDYHCWCLKGQALLSDVAEVDQVYPAHRGTRPYIIGTDVLEPHVLYKQSHVRSWKHSQDEINDFSNLRMDATRQSVFPTAKVKAGKNIDYKAVQRRDGQGIILVRDMDDVEWDRPPGPPPNVQNEVNLLQNDFDEIAGIFSQNSVQSNRQIGETVGGMQIISANANATSEFDLLCFIATWVEPVLSQIVYLEQYYEDDANMIAIAGKKAQLFTKFGVDQVTDELLESQISVSVDVKLGSSDPMQRLVKFKTTMDIAMPFLAQATKEGKAEVRYDEIFQEIFGQAGYRNGSERFITYNPDGKPPIDPQQMEQLQQQGQQLEQENSALKLQLKDKSAAIQVDAQNKQQQTALDHAGRLQEIAAADKAKRTELLFKLLTDTMDARISAGQTTDAALLDTNVQMILGLMGHAVQHAQNQTQLAHDSQHAQDTLQQDGELARAAQRQQAQTTAPPRNAAA